MQTLKPKSFTIKSKQGLLRVLATPAAIQIPGTPDYHKIKAIWDTGASGSVITKKVATQLNLTPTGKVRVATTTGVAFQNTYTVNIGLPNGFTIMQVIVSEAAGITGGCDALIGMDLITLGDFSITNHNGTTCFSFRIPSSHEIDYFKSPDYGIVSVKATGSFKPPLSRNAPCPCNSGKQYKRCHGKKKVN